MELEVDAYGRKLKEGDLVAYLVSNIGRVTSKPAIYVGLNLTKSHHRPHKAFPIKIFASDSRHWDYTGGFVERQTRRSSVIKLGFGETKMTEDIRELCNEYDRWRKTNGNP